MAEMPFFPERLSYLPARILPGLGRAPATPQEAVLSPGVTGGWGTAACFLVHPRDQRSAFLLSVCVSWCVIRSSCSSWAREAHQPCRCFWSSVGSQESCTSTEQTWGESRRPRGLEELGLEPGSATC